MKVYFLNYQLQILAPRDNETKRKCLNYQISHKTFNKGAITNKLCLKLLYFFVQ